MSEDNIFAVVRVKLTEPAFVETFGDDDKTSAIIEQNLDSISIFIYEQKHMSRFGINANDVFCPFIEGVKRPPHVRRLLTDKDPRFAGGKHLCHLFQILDEQIDFAEADNFIIFGDLNVTGNC